MTTRAVSVAQLGSVGGTSFRNKIINGDMRIDQRTSAASKTIASGSTYYYTLDRWAVYAKASQFSYQQNAGSVTPPTGFTNYLGLTSLAATTPAAGDLQFLTQIIERTNMTDLAWATAYAKTVTVSFWVYTSVTGTHSAALGAGGFGRNYGFTYSVPTANTWQYVSVTVPGDTGGTWTDERGLCLAFNLGSGTNQQGTANTWGSTLFVTGAVSVSATNGAKFYITGVQIEAGSTATPFECRPYGLELALCQRYYEVTNPSSEMTPVSVSGNYIMIGFSYKVTKRATPTVTTNITDANYTAQWGLAQAGFTTSGKTGTVGIGFGATVDAFGVNLSTASFSPTPNALRTGWTGVSGSASFYSAAEL
jgi:hypothetical protein